MKEKTWIIYLLQNPVTFYVSHFFILKKWSILYDRDMQRKENPQETVKRKTKTNW